MKRESNDSEIRIGTPQTLQNATTFIKRRIFKYGPVVLGINSKCLLHPNIVADGGLSQGFNLIERLSLPRRSVFRSDHGDEGRVAIVPPSRLIVDVHTWPLRRGLVVSE
jgi:hypothetical protein